MIDKRYGRLLVIILFQSLALYGAEKPKIKRKTKSDFRAYAIARQQLKVAHENNVLIAKNNALLAQVLQATMQANALAAEHVKAIQEQNKIHLELLRMQQNAPHDQSGDFKSEPHSPSSSCPTPPSSVASSMSGNAHGRLAAAAHEVARFAMEARAVRSSRVSLSASSPNLQDLGSGASIRRKGRSGPSLPTVLSPVNAEAAAEGAISASASVLNSATFLSPDSSVVLTRAQREMSERSQANPASAAAAAGAALKIQITPVKDE